MTDYERDQAWERGGLRWAQPIVWLVIPLFYVWVVR
jgi:hypothetical protein